MIEAIDIVDFGNCDHGYSGSGNDRQQLSTSGNALNCNNHASDEEDQKTAIRFRVIESSPRKKLM